MLEEEDNQGKEDNTGKKSRGVIVWEKVRKSEVVKIRKGSEEMKEERWIENRR